MLPVAAAHAWIRHAWTASPIDSLDRWVSAITQVAGGLLVVHSIDQNLGAFRKHGLRSIALDWLRSFPGNRPPIAMSAHGSVRFGGSATLSSAMTPTMPSTLEERLAELRREFEEFSRTTQRRLEEVTQRVETVRGEAVALIHRTEADLRELAKRVEHTAVGGFKQQLFGILLAIYGAIVGAIDGGSVANAGSAVAALAFLAAGAVTAWRLLVPMPVHSVLLSSPVCHPSPSSRGGGGAFETITG